MRHFQTHRVPRALAIICVMLMAATRTHTEVLTMEIPEFIEIQAIEGATFGHGFDTQRHRLLPAGGGCVEYGTRAHVEGGGGGQRSDFQRYSSHSDLVRSMESSTSASLSAGMFGFGGSASYASDVLRGISTSRLNESVVAYSSDRDNWKYLDLSIVRLKPRYAEMLQDPARRGQFREECGDSFIFGIQHGREFIGTAHVTQQSMESWARHARSVRASASGWGVSAATSRAWANEMERSFGSRNIEVKAASTGGNLTNPASLVDLVQLFTNFNRQAARRIPLRLAAAPYSYAEGYPLDDPLTPGPQDAALSALADTLWELKGMIEEATFIRQNPAMFALGTSPVIRTRRLQLVRESGEEWTSEYDQLKQKVTPCVSEFTSACRILAEKYERRLPQLRVERSDLPTRYGSGCSQPVPLVADDGKLKFASLANGEFSRIKGDAEMGGGPGRFEVRATIAPEGRKLRMELVTKLAEWKIWELTGDRITADGRNTEFELVQRPIIFDLDDRQSLAQGSIAGDLSECEFAGQPVDATAFVPPTFANRSLVHGHLVAMTPKSPRGIQKWRGQSRGILLSISCEADGPGSDDNMVCDEPEFRPFALKLVNRLDRQADNWKPRAVAPETQAPTKKTLASILSKLPTGQRGILVQRHGRLNGTR